MDGGKSIIWINITVSLFFSYNTSDLTMGVKSLTSFIQEHPTLLADFKLHDTKVIIDGYGLLYYLYDLGALYGGEYKDFDDKCREFFTDFRKCNVTPNVVFDGACDMDDKKLSEIVTRNKNRLRAVARVSTEGRLTSGNVFPIFLDYVFLKVLNDMDIPFAFCDFEADNEIAGLANAWKLELSSYCQGQWFLHHGCEGWIHASWSLWEERRTIPSQNHVYARCTRGKRCIKRSSLLDC